MKWMLIVLIFDVGPVKTDLIFNSLSECLDAEMRMRAAYAMEHNAQI